MSTTTPDLTDKVRDLMNGSVGEVFKIMLGLEVQPAPPHDLHASGETLVAAVIGFIGDANGVVYIHLTASFARTLAGRLLGLAEAELEGEEMVNDAVGELSNMIVGAVKSSLCDSGSRCVLTIPSIVRGQNFKVEHSSSSQRRLLGFRCGASDILVELLMKYSG